MTFKQNWEKTSVNHSLSADVIEQMVRDAYPSQKLHSYEIISGGCGNLNVKVNIEKSYILRVYLRDPDAAYREQQLGNLLKETVPVPLTYYVGDCEGYRFAITEFLPGMTLRDLLLSDQDPGRIMYDVGVLLTKISAHHFPKSGFFDQNLNVVYYESCVHFIRTCLQNNTISAYLSHQIQSCLEKYEDLLPRENGKNLVHSDFDPSNILVSKIDEKWTITGVLDWEFSFSGSVLCDVANMLRYAHKMPPEFETLFLQGLKIELPDHWKIITYMLNIMSLLDFLIRYDAKNRPNQYEDICELIDFYVERLNQYQLD